MRNLKFAHKTRLAGWKTCRILLERRAAMGLREKLYSTAADVPAAPAPRAAARSRAPGRVGLGKYFGGATGSALPETSRRLGGQSLPLDAACGHPADAFFPACQPRRCSSSHRLPPGTPDACPGTRRVDKGGFQGPGGAGRAWVASEMCETRLSPGSFLERNCSQRNCPCRLP